MDHEDKSQSDGDDSRSGGGLFLVEYAREEREVFPDDTGVPLQPGSRFKLDYHLHSIGEAVTR